MPCVVRLLVRQRDRSKESQYRNSSACSFHSLDQVHRERGASAGEGRAADEAGLFNRGLGASFSAIPRPALPAPHSGLAVNLAHPA